MEKEVRRTGASFEFADKEELAFIQSLGQMETKTQSLRTKMREYTESILSLTEMYQRLSDSEKNSDFGRGLLSSIDQIKQRAGELKDNMGDLDAEIKHLASDTSTFDSLAGGVNLMVSAFQVGQGIIQMFGVENENAVKAIAKLQGAMAVTNGLVQIQNALQKQSAVMLGVTTLQRKAAAAAAAIEAAAVNGGTVATKAATVAQAAFNAVAKANPYVLLASAAVAVGAALFAFTKNSEEATKAEEERARQAEIQAAREQRALDRIRNANEKVGTSIGAVIAKYNILKYEWQQISSAMEKENWIEENQRAFEELGLSINSVVSADDAFVTSSDKVIEALKARARANALMSLYEDQIKDTYSEAATRAQEDMANGYTFKEGGRIPKNMLPWQYGLNQVSTIYPDGDYIERNRRGADQHYELTENGAKKLNERNYNIFYKKHLASGFADAEKTFTLWAEASAEADGLERALNNIIGINNESSSIAETLAPEGSIARLRQDIAKARQEWENATTDSDRATKLGTLQDLEKQLKKMTETTKELKNESAGLFDFNSKGIGDLGKKIKEKMSVLLYNSDEYAIEAERMVDFTTLQNLLKVALENGFSDVMPTLSEIFDTLQFDAGFEITDDVWTNLVDEINTKLEKLDLPKIKLDVTTGNISNVTTEVTQDAKKSTEAWQQAANAVNNLGGALNNLEDPSAKVAGIIMQAVANIALGFAQAAASHATGAAGVFGWIAAATAGLATMTATISSIKSVTKGGFANGGIVPGNSFSGDNLHTSDYGINSGELILNRSQQNVIASQLQGGASKIRVEGIVSGPNILLAGSNYALQTGKAVKGLNGYALPIIAG